MKKYLYLIGALIAAGAAAAVTVTEDFDWGPGVPGRKNITAGSSINRLATQTGGAVWITDFATQSKKIKGFEAFSGNGGPGNGKLTLSGANIAAGFSYAPAGNVTVATAEGSFAPGTSGVKGFNIGFQSADPDAYLLSNQNTDKIYVQVNANGLILLRLVIGGVTNEVKDKIAFNSGETIKLELTVDIANKTTSAKVTGAGTDNISTSILNWVTLVLPDWTVFAVNSTGASTVMLDSVSVGPLPITVGMETPSILRHNNLCRR